MLPAFMTSFGRDTSRIAATQLGIWSGACWSISSISFSVNVFVPSLMSEVPPESWTLT